MIRIVIGRCHGVINLSSVLFYKILFVYSLVLVSGITGKFVSRQKGNDACKPKIYQFINLTKLIQKVL